MGWVSREWGRLRLKRKRLLACGRCTRESEKMRKCVMDEMWLINVVMSVRGDERRG